MELRRRLELAPSFRRPGEAMSPVHRSECHIWTRDLRIFTPILRSLLSILGGLPLTFAVSGVICPQIRRIDQRVTCDYET